MNRSGKPMRDRPPRAPKQPRLEWPGGVVPEWAKAPQAAKRRASKAKGASKRERLQKVMAQSGYGSRRNIEILIAQGHITVNGQPAKLGDQVGPGDRVKLDGKLIRLRYGEPLPRVLMYHKPTGEIVTRDDPEGRPTVFDKLPKVNGGRWVSVGRLDFNTEGLLLFTTSGEMVEKLTHPRFEVEREYAVRIMGEITQEISDRLLKTGVDIDGENCTFDSIEDRGGEGSNHWYHVVLREGRNREVRRMFDAVGLMVSRLMRVRFGNVELPSHVKRGMLREMEEEQVQELMAFAGMNETAADDGEEDVDDELDAIGNRVDPRSAPAEVERDDIDDDVGNRWHGSNAPELSEENEPNGNRGTYVPGAGEKPPRFQRLQPSQHAKAHVDGYRPVRESNREQGHGHGQGPGPGQGKGPRHGRNQKKGFRKGGGEGANGNVAVHAPRGEGNGNTAHGHGHGAPQPGHKGPKPFRHGKRRKGGGQGGQPHAQQGQGGHAGQGGQAKQGGQHTPQVQGAQPPQGQGQNAGQPGQGKPGRHRRNKNRNRGGGGGGGTPRGDAQPAGSGSGS
jgi:23S rRNA pseudouridine2605 synthase